MKKLLTTLLMICLTMSTTALGQQYIGTMDIDGSNKRLVYEHNGGVGIPHWSPDMTKITFHSPSSSTGENEVFTYNILTEQTCQLTSYGNQYGQNYPRFLDESTVWYSYTDQAGFSEMGKLIIDECDVLDSSLLTDYHSIGKQTNEFDLSENYIAYYVQNSSSSPSGEIYIAPKSDVNDTTRLTSNSTRDANPDINSAESQIVYVHDSGSTKPQNIFVMDIDGNNKTKITFLTGTQSSNTYAFPLWSDDGSKIYSSYSDDSQSDIVVMNADGSGWQNITNTPNYDERIGGIRNNTILFYTTEELFSNFLYLPPISVLPCDDECVAQPVAVDLIQPIKGATIPIKIPEGVEFCGISMDGLYTQDWDTSVFYNGDTSEISVGLLSFAGDTIPTGLTTVFNVLFKAEPECQNSNFIHWDTAMMGTSLELHFSDMNHTLLDGYFDYDRDSSEILGYTPGDVAEPLDGQVLVDDLVSLVDFLFKGGPAPCVMAAADVSDFNCQLFVNDLTFLVDYLFKGGADPNCGCTSPAPIAKLNSDVSIKTHYENGITSISINSEIDLKALQLTLSGDKVNGAVSLIDSNIELIAETNTLGLLDLEGDEIIHSGNYNLLQLNGEYEIVEAIASDMKNNAIFLTTGASKDALLPTEYALNQNYPNPFNPTTEIGFNLSNAGDITLEIYNIMGQKVSTLIDERMESGSHLVTWDSRDNTGQSVSSGIYFYRLITDEFIDTKKMTLLK